MDWEEKSVLFYILRNLKIIKKIKSSSVTNGAFYNIYIILKEWLIKLLNENFCTKSYQKW